MFTLGGSAPMLWGMPSRAAGRVAGGGMARQGHRALAKEPPARTLLRAAGPGAEADGVVAVGAGVGVVGSVTRDLRSSFTYSGILSELFRERSSVGSAEGPEQVMGSADRLRRRWGDLFREDSDRSARSPQRPGPRHPGAGGE